MANFVLSVPDRIMVLARRFVATHGVYPTEIWIGDKELKLLLEKESAVHLLPYECGVLRGKEMKFSGMTLRVMESPGIRVGISIEA